jgi:multicomponent Na+:H+ antiporter subunit D
VSTTAAYALIRIGFDVFTVSFFTANPLIADAVVLLASISIVVGSLLAAMQTEIKRVFAYSSVAQFGMIVVAVGLNSRTALFGAVIHLIGHGLMKATLFMGTGLFSDAYGASTIRDYAGLAKRAPYTSGAMAVTGLALVGIPPSIGILGKWYIGLGAVESGAWSVAVVIFVSTLLSLSYVYQLVEALYFTPLDEPAGGESTADGAVDHVTVADSAVADGGHAGRIAAERVAVVAVLAISTVVLFASVGLFDAMLDPVFGRFFQ